MKYSVLTLVVGASLILCACDPIKGSLVVSENLNYLTKADSKLLDACKKNAAANPKCANIDLSKGLQTNLLGVGTYPIQVDAPNDHKINISIQASKDSAINLKYDLPNGQKLSKNSANIDLPAEYTGQPFDLHGLIETNVSNSDEQSSVESCSYTIDTGRQECHEERNNLVAPMLSSLVADRRPGDGPGDRNGSQGGDRPGDHGGDRGGDGPGDRNGSQGGDRPGDHGDNRDHGTHTVCTEIFVTYNGRQDVRYYYETTTRSTILNFNKPKSNEAQAVMRKDDSSSNTVYTYRGNCN